jgi:hypothetical protein
VEIFWQGVLIVMPALGEAAGNIRFDAPKFPGQQGKEDHMLVYQRELGGPRGRRMVIDVNAGKYKMGKGKISDPNVTFVARDKIAAISEVGAWSPETLQQG